MSRWKTCALDKYELWKNNLVQKDRECAGHSPLPLAGEAGLTSMRRMRDGNCRYVGGACRWGRVRVAVG